MISIVVLNLGLLVFNIDRYDAMPMSEEPNKNNVNNNTDVASSGWWYSDILNLPGLGSKAFRRPNKQSGVALASWSESSLVNPEETGEYFEGDILLPSLQLRSGLINLSSRWPDAVVPYVFEGSFSKEEQNLILRAMNHFHNTTCVRFIPYDGQADYLAITNDGVGCTSAVGKLGGRQAVNLSYMCLKFGTIIHELMHTIGFLHEVSREDRDEYITVLEENIQDGRLEDFKAYQSNTFGVPYDYGSIMHQSEFAFAKSRDLKTIEAKKNHDGIILGQRNGLSEGDIEKINIMYECS